MNKSFFHIWFRTVFGLGFISAIVLLGSHECQDSMLLFGSDELNGQTENIIPIRVGVEEVRLDAVVLDKKGRQISDLTADDFDIYQDNKRQQIVASKYISETQPASAWKPSSSNAPKAAASIPAPRLAREDVRRTIVFLVDDFSMKRSEEVHRTRLCLKKYVESQMQPGDLVAIMQTYRGTSSLSAFTADRKELLERIENIHFKPPYLVLSIPNFLGEDFIPQPMAIDFCIRALKDMPGRKFLMLMSLNISNIVGIDSFYNRMADSALRAGVVIHTLDLLGLADTSADAQPLPYVNSLRSIQSPWITDRQYSLAATRMRQIFGPIRLSQKTGGMVLTGKNFFINGIADLEEEMKGYYMLSYIPPASTFNEKNRNIYKQIKVKVKRAGAQVHTRDGFIGLERSLDPEEERRNPLIKAMFSPFQYKDLAVSMASGYVEDPSHGYRIRAWVHLDGQALGVTDESEGSHSVSVEAVAATSDIEGNVQDSANRQLKLALNDADVAWIRAHGLKFSLSLNKEKPGAYYVRVAIKDHVSGKMGSAYEFMEIPDLKKGSLALSSIVVLSNKDDASWIRTVGPAEPQSIPDQPQSPTGKSQALRRFKPGDGFEFAAVAYNAKTKDGLPPDLESQIFLYRDGNEIYKSDTEPVRYDRLDNLQRVPITKGLLLANTLPPGDYIMILQVRDKCVKGKNNTAEQLLQFEISAN